MSYVLRLMSTRWSAPAIVLALGLGAISGFADDSAFIKLPPPVYGGLVKDYMQQPYGSSPSVQIFARRETDGKLLASANTTAVREGVNYSISLPMLSGASEEIVGLKYGDTATLSFLDGDVMWANIVSVTPKKPGYQRLDVTLCHDENGDGIADEYAAYMALKMEEYGLAGAYDPDADSNGDGITNREHYLAGTNPFAGLTVGGEKITDQVCTISSLMNVQSFAGEEYFAISFNAVEEFQYAVLALDDLSKGWGNATKVATREQRDYGDLEEDHWPETSGTMTLYVPKGKESQRFYKLVVGEW